MAITLKNGMKEIHPDLEKQMIGGCDETCKNVFFTFGEIVGNIVKGLIVFGSEGGKSAGLTVK